MQTLIQVVTAGRGSLRDRIVNDPRLASFDLEVVKALKPGRSPGWAKLRCTNVEEPGVINVEWHGPSRMLLCRVVNKSGTRPNRIAGAFVDYLLARYLRKIVSITIIPFGR